MKYLQIIIFLFISVFSFTSAQSGNAAIPDTTSQLNNTKEISVAEMVEKQIALAQAKQWANRQEPSKQKAVKKVSIKNQANSDWLASIASQVKLSPEMVTRIGIILLSSMFVFGSVVTRRLVLSRKSKLNNLRSNIQSLRLEKAIVKKETKLKNVRENLLKSSINLNNAEGSLAQKAKELKIAKGEIMLAAKIKSYELSICSNDR